MDEPAFIIFLSLGVGVIAFLYSSVGHAGASGYIAVMALAGLAATEIKPAALFLNVLVASITFWQFYRAGHFVWRLFWPFALLAVPFAFLGGYLQLPIRVFHLLVGAVLLFSAARFWLRPSEDPIRAAPTRMIALGSGAGLGLLSGLTGTGGGIFLTPLLLFMRWAQAKQAAAVSAFFILCNSLAGLLGNLKQTGYFPSFVLWLAAAVVFGGTLGSYLGSQRLKPEWIKRLLAVVLLIAGMKLLFT